MEAIANGIELTGTLYTSAQGDAKDKLAMTDQIFDTTENKSQKEINATLKSNISGNNTALTNEINTIKSTYAKSADVEAKVKVERDRINTMLNGAPAAYDTLKEIADKLNANDTLHDAINNSVNALSGLHTFHVTEKSDNSRLFDYLDQDPNNQSNVLILFSYNNGYDDGSVDTVAFTIERATAVQLITNIVIFVDGTIAFVVIEPSNATIQVTDINGANIKDNTITNAKLANKTITNAKIANDTIIKESIADGAVVESKLAADAVTTTKIKNGAVTSSKIDDYAVTVGKLDADAVLDVNIKNGAVTTDKIADNCITANKIGVHEITSGQIDYDTIGVENMADNAIETAKIKDKAVTKAKLADDVQTILNNTNNIAIFEATESTKNLLTSIQNSTATYKIIKYSVGAQSDYFIYLGVAFNSSTDTPEGFTNVISSILSSQSYQSFISLRITDTYVNIIDNNYIGANLIQDNTLSGVALQNNTITKDKLDTTLQTTINNLNNFKVCVIYDDDAGADWVINEWVKNKNLILAITSTFGAGTLENKYVYTYINEVSTTVNANKIPEWALTAPVYDNNHWYRYKIHYTGQFEIVHIANPKNNIVINLNTTSSTISSITINNVITTSIDINNYKLDVADIIIRYGSLYISVASIDTQNKIIYSEMINENGILKVYRIQLDSSVSISSYTVSTFNLVYTND